MTKEDYLYFQEKDSAYLKKAKLLYALFIAIFVSLIALMFVFQIISYFVTFILIMVIMTIFYRFVFREYIFFIRNRDNFKRIKLMKRFDLSDEVLEYFNAEVFKQLYDDDFIILHKNDVYVLARKEIENSITDIGLAVHLMDHSTQEINPSTRELSNEISGYSASSAIVKIVILVKDVFEETELNSLQYDSAVHRNTVVIGIEKSTSTLIYNYFLNGEVIDTALGEMFKVDLTRPTENKE